MLFFLYYFIGCRMKKYVTISYELFFKINITSLKLLKGGKNWYVTEFLNTKQNQNIKFFIEIKFTMIL